MDDEEDDDELYMDDFDLERIGNLQLAMCNEQLS